MFDNADQPANVREEDSETPWLTSETLKFMEQAKAPWCAHVSYIKPHWPYIVPAPYHTMFGPRHVSVANRADVERDNPQPVYGAFMGNKIAQAFQQDDVRAKVIPAYMGLIKQCDDQFGVRPWLSGRHRSDQRHDDRSDVRPWGLSGRSLAG